MTNISINAPSPTEPNMPDNQRVTFDGNELRDWLRQYETMLQVDSIGLGAYGAMYLTLEWRYRLMGATVLADGERERAERIAELAHIKLDAAAPLPLLINKGE